ncbi:MAG: response regulator, partial [Deltaproteobacteria bacterium]|nr:response regulator [Deltaproteobacteria bacterium]
MKTKILIIDDNEQNLYLLQVLLEGYGHEVVPAYDGKDAFEKAQDSPPDMVISDILMPVMDGFTLCRRWKKNDRLKKIPFIFYTATYTDSKDEEFALSLGAERFIVKPVEPEEFIKIIQDVMSDLENGRIKPQKPVLEKNKDIFKLYSERLVQKLEKKMLDLEKELAERKRAEEKLEECCENLEELVEKRTKELRESEAKLSGILSAVTDCICLVDEHHNILWTNQAMVRLFGPELVGKKCYDMFHLREVACESCTVDQTFSCGRGQEFESECLTVDGRKIPVWCVSGVADRYEDGRPKTVVYVYRD